MEKITKDFNELRYRLSNPEIKEIYWWNSFQRIQIQIQRNSSKYDEKRENNVILLMITDGKKWHYLPVKSLAAALLRGITSNHKKGFYCLNCFLSYAAKNKLEKHYHVCKNHDHCYVEMPKEDNKILKYNHGENSMKVPFIIYVELEPLLKKLSIAIIILRNHQQLKYINVHPIVIHCLEIIHFM